MIFNNDTHGIHRWQNFDVDDDITRNLEMKYLPLMVNFTLKLWFLDIKLF